MSLQTAINEKQGFGVVGAFYDDSPRRVQPMTVAGGTPIAAVKASGTITMTDVPTTADTVTIGGIVYTFKDTLAAAYDVKIGAGEEATGDNLKAAINADGTAGVNYFAGTLANPVVTAVSNGAGVVTVSAIYAGTQGNAITLAESADNTTVSGAALTGGVDADAVGATVGYAFSINASDKSVAVAGGSTEFAGILVNPKTQPHTGLDATLVVESGKVGELCTMGRIVVKPLNNAVIGYSAYYETATGKIYAYSGTGSQSGKTLIAGSKFVIVDSTSPAGLAVVQLG